MDITYHLVPKSYYESRKSAANYLPRGFDAEGFIHCTDGEFMASTKANQYYADAPELLVLLIDKAKLTSPVRYDDPERMFSHIYGPLNWDAIIKVSSMIRDCKGAWIFPIHERI